MFFIYYIVMAAIVFWAISTHPQTRGKPFLSLIGAAIVPLTLPLIPIAGAVFWAYTRLKPREALSANEAISALILRSAKQGGVEISVPKLRYESIFDFADSHEGKGSIEWFPNYSGMRFWIQIGDLAYFVEVETIDPAKKDDSGVVISATVANSVL